MYSGNYTNQPAQDQELPWLTFERKYQHYLITFASLLTHLKNISLLSNDCTNSFQVSGRDKIKVLCSPS